MRKSLKFKPHLADQIRAGIKTITWRLFDDKDLQSGDIVDFYENGQDQPFAYAEVTNVRVKSLGALEDADWVGHEKFASDEEMYETYRRYYGSTVGPDTEVKIVAFKLKDK